MSTLTREQVIAAVKKMARRQRYNPQQPDYFYKRLARILTLRYGLNGDARFTQQQIADNECWVHGHTISSSRIGSIERRAIRELMHYYRNQKPPIIVTRLCLRSILRGDVQSTDQT